MFCEYKKTDDQKLETGKKFQCLWHLYYGEKAQNQSKQVINETQLLLLGNSQAGIQALNI